MKNYRKILACLISTLLCFSLVLSVSAQTVDLELPELATVLKIDEDVSVIMPSTPKDDPVFSDLKIENAEELLSLMEGLGTQAVLVHDGNQIFINKNESENTKIYFNLQTFTDAQMNAFLSDYNTDASNLVSLAEIYMKGDMPFVEVNFTGTDDYGVGVNEYIIFTIVNGYTLALSQNSTEAIPEDSINYIRSLVDTLEFTRIDVLVQEDDINAEQAMFVLFLLIAMIALFVGSIIFIKVRSKKKKSEQVVMSAKLSNYRQDREEGYEKAQKLFFKNKTEITDSEIDSFSFYQTFFLRPLTYVYTMMATMICFLFTITVGSDWWFVALFVIIFLFTVFKFVTSPKTNAKAMKKVYKNLRSRVALYNFYDYEFQISGIERDEFHPYFQITEIAENKNSLYFFFGNDNPYFIDMSGFTEGEANEFKTFISKKTRKKIK